MNGTIVSNLRYTEKEFCVSTHYTIPHKICHANVPNRPIMVYCEYGCGYVNTLLTPGISQ